MSRIDVAFIGSSPNALVGAARLAKGGARVVVIETRGAVGGPVTTEEFAPGFHADAAVMSASIEPEIARALGLNVKAIHRDTVTALGGPEAVTIRARPDLGRSFEAAVEVLRGIYKRAPPDLPTVQAEDAATLASLGASLRGLGPRGMHEVLRLSFMSARDYLLEHVDDERVRAVLAGMAVRALSEGPFAPGTLFGLLHHGATGDAFSRRSARGGLGALSATLADVARSAGVEIVTGAAHPLTVLVDDGRARGARLGDGSRVEADHVVSDYDARATFTSLVAPPELEPEQNRAIRAYRYRGSVARVHLGLTRLPEFAGVSAEALRGTLVVAPDVASIERAWDDAKRGAPSRRPYIEATLPTLDDPGLAPEGGHVLDAWVQYVPYGRGDRQALLTSVVGELARFAPDLPETVVHHRVSLPEDLERRFGLTEGHLYGGEVRLDQSFFLRPMPGEAHYGTPIAHLYLGGSAAHPGGYSGLGGWNVAGRLLSATSRG